MKGKFIVISFLLLSCGSNREYKFDKLERERDSLQSILNIVNEKYIFDSIVIINEPAKNNLNKIGTDHNIHFTISAFNKSDYFVKYDTIINNVKMGVDTLTYEKGVYKYKTKIKRNNQPVKVDILTGNKSFGKYKQGTLLDRISISH